MRGVRVDAAAEVDLAGAPGPTCQSQSGLALVIPMRIAGSPNSASGAAKLRLETITSSAPSPSARPCTAVTIGFESCTKRRQSSPRCHWAERISET